MEYVQVDKRRVEERRESQTFWDSHHEIVRRLVLGQRPTDIARDLGITKQTVSNVRNNPLVVKQLQSLHEKRDSDTASISAQIRDIAPKAVAILEEALDDPTSPWNARITAAKDILDRAGHAPVHRSESVTATLTVDEIMALKERAKANGLIASEPIQDAEEVE